jgi:hypothetical protein
VLPPGTPFLLSRDAGMHGCMNGFVCRKKVLW